jgi:hypothetical protein
MIWIYKASDMKIYVGTVNIGMSYRPQKRQIQKEESG